MADFKQARRKGRVTTPLGADVFLLRSFSGTDAISRLFSFEVDLVAARGTKVPFEKLLGKPLTVHLEVAPGAPGEAGPSHDFNGICVRFAETGQDEEFTYYSAGLAPRLWLLTQRARSRIFQHKSVDEIVKGVLDELAIVYDIKPGLGLPERDFCVQYRETDFNFISRLMEEEGLFYYFTHADETHRMIIANSRAAHRELPFAQKFIYEELAGGARDEDRVTSWEKAQEVRPGTVWLGDYSFTKPNEILRGESKARGDVKVGSKSHVLSIPDSGKLEVYDWPGEFAQRFDEEAVETMIEDARRSADIRMDEETARAVTLRGTSNIKHLMAGHRMALDRHFSGNGTYVVTAVTHWAEFGADTRAKGEASAAYHNQFTCIPEELPFRPRRITPKPVVPGSQTATVVGPKGEEIWCDRYGRVKVQFHWDREGKRNEGSSCWIRVGTIWAGQQWGAIHVPRIGQEVIVDFLEGDPDQPIIVGSVYNAALMPPYELPGKKTQSGLKTRSTLKGGVASFNELRFEDLKGKEQVYFHAEKDFQRMVEHDDDLHVGNDQTIRVERDRTEGVDRNEEVKVKKNRTHKVDGDDSLEVGGKTGRSVKVRKGNHALTVDRGKSTIDVKQGDLVTSLAMGDQKTELKMGSSSTEAKLGKISAKALQSIELTVGSSTFKVDPSGVTIKGLKVTIEGRVTTSVKGTVTQVEGSAITQVKGGLVMIG